MQKCDLMSKKNARLKRDTPAINATTTGNNLIRYYLRPRTICFSSPTSSSHPSPRRHAATLGGIALPPSTTWTCLPFFLSRRPAPTCPITRPQVMILTRIEDPEIALLAFAESEGNTLLAAKRMSDGRYVLLRTCICQALLLHLLVELVRLHVKLMFVRFGTMQ